ncbi:hypothetical protein GUITHDRAFT_49846, partial [Guillardia theta CCMP2712]
QITDGMNHLSLNGVVHRNLTCASILVFNLDIVESKNLHIKICELDQAVCSGGKLHGNTAPLNTKLKVRPLRWMAPESLQYEQFSEKSDVWAFGVTMWEILSWASAPFSHIVDDAEVERRVLAGERLLMPSSSHPGTFEIAQECWKDAKAERPSF